MNYKRDILTALALLVISIGTLFFVDLHYRRELAGALAWAIPGWLVAVASIGWLCWIYPKWSTKGLRDAAELLNTDPTVTPKDRFDALRDVLKAEGDVRLSVVQAFGILVLLGGLYFTYRTLTSNSRAAFLDRFNAVVGLMTDDPVLKQEAGKRMMNAIEKEPEGRELLQGLEERLRQATPPHDKTP